MVKRSLVSPRRFAAIGPLAVCALALGLAACASSAPPPATPGVKPAPSTAGKPSAPAGGARAPGHLVRAEVDEALSHGPPWLLRRVVTEEVLRDGKFVGWRLLALPRDWAVDLKPGDVVTSVNGATLERPDDLFSAWVALGAAREMKIAYERDGAPHELVLPIDGEPSKEARLPAEPQRQRATGIRKGTVVIEDDAPADSSSTEY
jgi:hypothetical protein